MAVLKFRNLNTGQATPVPTGEFTVGRDDSTYVQVEDNSVSRHHARIVNQDDGFFVEDLGSVNGTATRGALIHGRVKIDLGEVVYIGSVPFRVDPEVGGAEPVSEPAMGRRPANRTYLRKNTERIPMVLADAAVAAAAVVEATAPPKRNTAPLLDVRQPEKPSLAHDLSITEPPSRLPTIRPGKRPEPREKAVQAPLVDSPPLSLSDLAVTKAARSPVLEPVSEKVAKLETLRTEAPIPEARPPVSTGPVIPPGNFAAPLEDAHAFDRSRRPEARTNWLLIGSVFLAGMGAGILIGLFFAKFLFIDMGMKGVP